MHARRDRAHGGCRSRLLLRRFRSAVLNLPSGTVTFMFTDVEASTDLVRRHGERYVALQADARSLLRKAFATHGGHEVDTQGDSFFVSFSRARAAALAAVDAQQALAAHPWPDGGVVRVRMGLHTAEPHISAEGYVGVGVHRAARICAIGHGGQILLSRSAAALIDDEELERVTLRDLGAHQLKGLQTPERIFQLVAEGLASEFPPLDTLEGAGLATETATILFADVDSFTPLSEDLAPDQFRTLVAHLHRTLHLTLEQQGGRWVIVVGDGAMALFRSARAAVAAAVHLSEVIACQQWPGGRTLALNIGLHSGEVVATAYGCFGKAVNRADAVATRAKGGQILVSEATRTLIDEDPAIRLREIKHVERPLPFPLYEVVPQQPAESGTALPATP